MDRYREYTGRDISPHDTIVIGDTPNDIRCAHANGCTCFAVATGLYSVDDLRRAGANVVVPNLADPQPLYALL
jgi:phosphoglycolate phosphatase-like HAD superfamily hydrolase